MAQKTIVTLIDDLTGEEAEDITTVEFALEGVTYEIDLADDNAAKLRDNLSRYVAAARKTSARRPSTSRRAGHCTPARPAATAVSGRCQPAARTSSTQAMATDALAAWCSPSRPSSSSGQVRVGFKLAFYRRFLEVIRGYIERGEQVIVAGDVNTAYAELDLARPRENRMTSGFMPEERAALGEFFAAGLVDTFRHVRPAEAKYSWWSQRTSCAGQIATCSSLTWCAA